MEPAYEWVWPAGDAPTELGFNATSLLVLPSNPYLVPFTFNVNEPFVLFAGPPTELEPAYEWVWPAGDAPTVDGFIFNVFVVLPLKVNIFVPSVVPPLSLIMIDALVLLAAPPGDEDPA